MVQGFGALSLLHLSVEGCEVKWFLLLLGCFSVGSCGSSGFVPELLKRVQSLPLISLSVVCAYLLPPTAFDSFAWPLFDGYRFPLVCLVILVCLGFLLAPENLGNSAGSCLQRI